jgi:hypothetical protein
LQKNPSLEKVADDYKNEVNTNISEMKNVKKQDKISFSPNT